MQPSGSAVFRRLTRPRLTRWRVGVLRDHRGLLADRRNSIMTSRGVAAGRNANGRDATFSDFLFRCIHDSIRLARFSSSIAPCGIKGFVACLSVPQSVLIESHNHTRKVVCAEAGEGMVDQQFGSGSRILYVPDLVDGFLVVTHVP